MTVEPSTVSLAVGLFLLGCLGFAVRYLMRRAQTAVAGKLTSRNAWNSDPKPSVGEAAGRAWLVWAFTNVWTAIGMGGFVGAAVALLIAAVGKV